MWPFGLAGVAEVRPYCPPTPHRRWTSSHELRFSVSSEAELAALLELLPALQNRMEA